jgi:hypothetical protein
MSAETVHKVRKERHCIGDVHYLPAGRYPDDRETCECGGWQWTLYSRSLSNVTLVGESRETTFLDGVRMENS